MQVENRAYKIELCRLEEERKEYERNEGVTNPDNKKYRDLTERIDELKYLDVAIRNGADERVQYAILNLRLREKPDNVSLSIKNLVIIN